MTLEQHIRQEIKDNKIIAYIKGTKEMPVCGFSARVVRVFRELGVEFEVRNALSDEEYRSSLKAITDWHTIPQVFVNGEFIGGCDIVLELYESGALQEQFGTSIKK